jgi:hypothetical protein
MCQHFELVRAFILRPHKLYKSGAFIKEMAAEFESIQRGYYWILEIVFLKDGGFAICLPQDLSAEDMLDATLYLSDFLAVPPRLVDLSQIA